MVPILKIRTIVKTRVQIHERTWECNFNNTPRKSRWTPFSFPVGSDPGRLTARLMGACESELHKRCNNHSKGVIFYNIAQKVLYMYIYTYTSAQVCIYIFIHTYTSGKWLSISPEKWRKCFYILLYIVVRLKEKKSTKPQSMFWYIMHVSSCSQL